MSRTYKVTGINLKGMPMGESDRLLTILTRERGLIRAVAPGARKHVSKLGGRSGLFVVNDLLISQGKSLDRISQAETIESYPGLSQSLGKLTASQYLAELVLGQALSQHPQEDLFCLFTEHLSRLERSPNLHTLPLLAHATFHLLALAGIAPQVQACSITQQPLAPNFQDSSWRVGFSTVAGGIVDLAALKDLAAQQASPGISLPPQRSSVAEKIDNSYQVVTLPQKLPRLSAQLDATQLALLQQLAQPDLPLEMTSLEMLPLASSPLRPNPNSSSETAWIAVERILRQYTQYHFEQPIRSAALIDTCFVSASLAP
ncbi:MAG: DNA repair protein RecO [Leptolyngbyaceae bacterium]|nr:DNA repair protein RecO [Leptolyngbyaceae bacterium]